MKKSSLICAVLVLAAVIAAYVGCVENDPIVSDNGYSEPSDIIVQEPVIADPTDDEPIVEYTDEEKVLVDLKTSWRYLDDGTDPSADGERTSWTAVDFDDSAWKTNEGTDAVFGAKSGVIGDLGSGYVPKVLLNHFQSDSTCVPTYFFRATFNLESLPVESLSLVGALAYDDAAIVYVNGVRVAAFDEPEGGFETNLTYGGSGNTEPKEVVFSASPELLQMGKNVLAVELHQQRSNSSDIYFSMHHFSISVPEAENVSMNVGEDETMRNFTWYYNSATSGTVQYAVRNGDEFPAEFSSVDSHVTEHENTYIHRATISGLEPNTEYVYRISNGRSVTENYYFKTDPLDSFNFIFVGDPQIGASWGGQDDAGKWAETLEMATEMFPDTSFLIAAGDQVEICTDEANYRGFLSADSLKGLAIATTIGNHDTDALLYTQHFNNPNTDINGMTYGNTAAGCNYYYTYNNALFIHLNANNISVAEHKAFIESAIVNNIDAQWRIVVMHQAIFGAGPYFNESIIINMRNLFAPVFEEFDIDVVLNGHEHVYARSYMMNGFEPDTANGVQSSVHNPEGILYVTGPSSSGSKYYDLLDDASIPHVAVKEKNVTAFSNVEITDSSFKITVYRVSDGSVLDTFEITKDTETEVPQWINNVAESVKADDFSLELNTSYSGGALTSVTFGGTESLVGLKETQIRTVSETDVLKIENGILYATKEGTAEIVFEYMAKLPYGSQYLLVSEPVTVTVNVGSKDSLRILMNSADNISGRDYTETVFNEIKALSSEALQLIDNPDSSSAQISAMCQKLSEALQDYCIDEVLSKGASYTTTEPNYHSFSDSFVDDGRRLSDGRKSNNDPTVNSYAAWNNSVNPVVITMDLGESVASNVYNLYSVGGFWGISNCETMKIYGSSDGENFVPIGSAAEIISCGNAAVIDDNQTTLNCVTVVSEEIVNYQYIKFEISVNGHFLWIDEAEVKLVVGTPMTAE